MLQIPGARSLKDRRRVVRSFNDRVRARLPVSVAEVGELERYQVATLGLATVSNDSARCQQVLAQARTVASSIGDAVLADAAVEVSSFGFGGRGVEGGIEQALDADDPWQGDDDPFGGRDR